jgi:O-antigen/teichoic acid export membrane protein
VITLFRQFFSNLFHIGAIQVTNMVLQFYLIALVVERVGIGVNGLVLTSLSLSWLATIFINYAGNQTIPLAFAHSNASSTTAQLVTDHLSIRFLFFTLISLIILVVFNLQPTTYNPQPSFNYYLLGIIPILFSELINPQAFYLSVDKMQFFNLANLIGRSAGVFYTWYALPWVNAWVGMGLSAGFLILWIHLLVTKTIRVSGISMNSTRKLFKENMPLVGGNIVVQLQQSVFLYGLGLTAPSTLLGAYSIIDKITSGVRNLLMAFTNAIFPLSIRTLQEDEAAWKGMRRQVNDFLFSSLMVAGLLIWFLSPSIAAWFSAGETTALVTIYIRWLAAIPFIIGINGMNVLELIMRKQFHQQFRISTIMLSISLLLSATFLYIVYQTPELDLLSCTGLCVSTLIPAYLLITESVNLYLYEKSSHHRP